MSSISESVIDVKEVPNGTFVPGGEDRATLESDLSAPPAPSGRDVPFFFNSDGVNAINSGVNAQQRGEAPSSPTGLVPLVTNCDSGITSGFAAIAADFILYKYRLEGTPSVFLHLENKSDESQALYRVDRKASSRYFPEGRAKMKKRLWKRLDGTRTHGIFMTFTVDTKRYDLLEAWEIVWKQFKKVMDALNKYRQRNMGAKGSLKRIAVLEQTKQGYPHLHVFFPGLRYVIDDLSKLDEWWGMGSVRTERTKKPQSARGYVLKYIGKMSGWSETCMAILWYFHIRLYNLSHCFFIAREAAKWKLIAIYTTIEEMAKGLGFSIADVSAILDSDVKFVYIRSP